MTTFSDISESIRLEDASYAKLFDGGTNISQNLRRKFEADADYRQRLVETMQFIRDTQAGRIAPARFAEAMTTSDFPILLGGIMDRTLLGGYREYPASYEMWCRSTGTSRTSASLPVVPQPRRRRARPRCADGGIPVRRRRRGAVHLRRAEVRRKFKFLESFVNDNLGAFSEVPMALGRAARRTTARSRRV